MLLVSGKHQSHENEAACTGKLWGNLQGSFSK